MTTLDTANAIVTLIDMMEAGKLGDIIVPDEDVKTSAAIRARDMHHSAIARLLGCSHDYVSEHVYILRGKQDKALRRAVQEGKVPHCD